MTVSIENSGTPVNSQSSTVEKCHWCGSTNFDKESVERIEIYLPHFTGPRIHIKNDLCPECGYKARTAFAEVELAIKKTPR